MKNILFKMYGRIFSNVLKFGLKFTKQNKCYASQFAVSDVLSFILCHDALSSPYLIYIYFLAVHLIIPGLNETTVKLPASLMFEISDALKTQLGKQKSFVFKLCND